MAVMGCVVNGPGESKHANIGISLPGTFEEPKAPVYVDGEHTVTLKGDRLVDEFKEILRDYVRTRYGADEPVGRGDGVAPVATRPRGAARVASGRASGSLQTPRRIRVSEPPSRT